MQKILVTVVLLLACSTCEGSLWRPAVYKNKWIVWQVETYFGGEKVWAMVADCEPNADTEQEIWERYKTGEYKLLPINQYPSPVIESDYARLVHDIRKYPAYYGLGPKKKHVLVQPNSVILDSKRFE